MKAICTIKAFYNGAIIKPGEEVNIKGKKLPSWAKAIDEGTKTLGQEGTKNDDAQKDVNDTESVSNDNTTPEGVNDDEVPFEVGEGVNNEENAPEDDLTGKTEVELSAILDELLTQALDKGIEIEIGTKPIIDSIVELRQKLEGINQ